MNAKEMLVDMFMSPWFGGESTTTYTFDSAHFESKFGNEQLLTPEQLSRKTQALTGVAWRASPQPDGRVFSKYEELSVLLGGIDSAVVTSRAIELTPTMTSILMTHATESACPAVVRQFLTPINERSLFTVVEETMLPLAAVSSLITLPSEELGDWKTLLVASELERGPQTFSLTFTNPYVGRTLYVDSITITSPSGATQTIRGNDSRLVSSVSDQGAPDCYHQWEGYALCFGGSLSFATNITEAGRYLFESSMSSELSPPSPEGYLEIALAMKANGNMLTANTKNATAIKEQISILFEKLHGTVRTKDSEQVLQVYEIFAAALTVDDSGWRFENCKLYLDGLFYDDMLSSEEILSFRTEGIYAYNVDWNKRNLLEKPLITDPLRAKYAWTAVMMYMLSHYDYLHE
tara:strand:+ start:1 stop:1218 length:1218 start_codon:yes stop_codon:yes gene_type:complete